MYLKLHFLIYGGDVMFVAFEGIDASGKGTQIKRLEEYLKSIGEKVWTTAEPTDGPIGNMIKEIQKGNLISEPDEFTMLSLYVADRAEHQKEICNHISKNYWVLCDRYMYSSEAYQDIKDRYIQAWQLNEDFFKPNITIVLDIPEDVAIERIQKRGKPVEIFEKKEFLAKVRSKYKNLYYNNSGIYLVDGTKTEEEVFEDIKGIIDAYIDLAEGV